MADERHGRAVCLRPAGRLDAESCAELRNQLASAFVEGVRSVVVDLSAVTEVDLSGLRVLAGAARHLREGGGGFVVVNAGPVTVTSMRINGMGDLLELPPSPPLRVVEGSGTGGPASRPPKLTVVPQDGLKLPG